MPKAHSATPETTPLARLDEGELRGVIGYQVAQAAVATVATFVRSAGEQFELRPVELTILVLVKNNPDVTPSRLAKALAVTAPNITTWINRLEHRDLVRRSLGTSDKRNQHLRATPAGIKLAQKALSAVLVGEHEAWPELTVGERAILVELLHKIARKR